MKPTRQINKNWIQIALVRAIKTVAQTALSLMTVGASMSEIDWRGIASISLVAGIMSILTTIATGIHDVEVDDYEGSLMIDRQEEKDIVRLDLTDELEDIMEKKVIRLHVKPDEDLESFE